MKLSIKIAFGVLGAILLVIAVLDFMQFQKTPPEIPAKAEPEKSLLGSTPVETVQNYIAKKERVNPSSVQIISDEIQNWPDSCLGLANENEICAQVVVAGHEIKAIVNGKAFVYRTNTNGTIVREE